MQPTERAQGLLSVKTLRSSNTARACTHTLTHIHSTRTHAHTHTPHACTHLTHTPHAHTHSLHTHAHSTHAHTPQAHTHSTRTHSQVLTVTLPHTCSLFHCHSPPYTLLHTHTSHPHTRSHTRPHKLTHVRAPSFTLHTCSVTLTLTHTRGHRPRSPPHSLSTRAHIRTPRPG